MLLRVLRRFCELAFPLKAGGLDTEPSVYEVDPSETVQTHAEHAAGGKLELPRNFTHVDVQGIDDLALVAAPRVGDFMFTDGAHKELHFGNVERLTIFATELMRRLTSLRQDVSRQYVERYVCSRLAEGDPEWIRSISSNPKGQSWSRPCEPKAPTVQPSSD
jgi:hypothetical protein